MPGLALSPSRWHTFRNRSRKQVYSLNIPVQTKRHCVAPHPVILLPTYQHQESASLHKFTPMWKKKSTDHFRKLLVASQIARQIVLKPCPQPTVLVTIPVSGIYIVKPKMLKGSEQVMSVTYEAIHKPSSQTLFVPLVNFSANAVHLSKCIVVAYATGPPKEVMTPNYYLYQ